MNRGIFVAQIIFKEVDLVDSIYRVKDEFQMRVREGIEISSEVQRNLNPAAYSMYVKISQRGRITRTRLSDGTGWTSFMGGGEVYLDLLSAKPYPIDFGGHEMQFIQRSKGGHDGKYKTGWNCDKCKRKSSKMASSILLGAKVDTAVSNVQVTSVDCFSLNKANVPVSLGTGSGKSNYYCGRFLGREAIPRSDGRCGPNNGPQCDDRKGFTKSLPPKVAEPHMCRNGFVMHVSNRPTKAIKPVLLSRESLKVLIPILIVQMNTKLLRSLVPQDII